MSDNARSRAVNSFADLATLYHKAQQTPDFIAAFGETTNTAIYSVHDEPNALDLPDADKAEAACALVMATVFDLFRDTRLDIYAERAAWGFVHSFHKLAETVGFAEDRACNDVRKLVRRDDTSEIGIGELEKAQLLAQSLTEARGVMEAIRDYAAEVFRVETGRPWAPARGSKVSGVTTASRIDSLDYLRARGEARREQRNPEGPAVVFSGGQVWEDYKLLYETLDDIKARIPHMILHTSAQRVGCDAVAAAWAAANGVPLIAWNLRRSQGKRSGFLRNESFRKLRPVEAVVCEGTFIQTHLAKTMRGAGVPLHVFRLCDQDIQECQRAAAVKRFAYAGARQPDRADPSPWS